MSVEATTETYEELVAHGSVLADFWGPQCAPCLALMPAVEKLEARSDGALRLVKVNAFRTPPPLPLAAGAGAADVHPVSGRRRSHSPDWKPDGC